MDGIDAFLVNYVRFECSDEDAHTGENVNNRVPNGRREGRRELQFQALFEGEAHRLQFCSCFDYLNAPFAACIEEIVPIP
jgi:hypothetical protein